MRLASLHPGATVEEVVANTGFDLVIPEDVPATRAPTPEERGLMGKLDPKGIAKREVTA
jgi:hypothetical protein